MTLILRCRTNSNWWWIYSRWKVRGSPESLQFTMRDINAFNKVRGYQFSEKLSKCFIQNHKFQAHAGILGKARGSLKSSGTHLMGTVNVRSIQQLFTSVQYRPKSTIHLTMPWSLEPHYFKLKSYIRLHVVPPVKSWVTQLAESVHNAQSELSEFVQCDPCVKCNWTRMKDNN